MGDVVLAVGVMIVFGAMAVAMAASARSDWADGRADGDAATQVFAVQQWWPALLALAVAIAAPIAILAA